MKNTIKLFLLVLALAGFALAQTATPWTTLAASMTVSATTINLASSTNVVAMGVDNVPLTGVYVDRDFFTITTNANSATGSGNVWNIKRVASGGFAIRAPHASGAVAIVAPMSVFDQGPYDKSGTCTASLFPYTIYVQLRTGNLARCSGGSWVVGTPLSNPAQPYAAFTTLSPANPIATNSTTHVAGTIWFSQIFIPRTVVLTGACQLNGATVTTDNSIVALYDSGGSLMANSVLTGVADASYASIYQCQAFTAKVIVPGPATYFAALQTQNTTDNFQSYAAGSAPTNYGTQSQTGTFGTLAAMTTPTTTFTANKGPLMQVY